MACCVLAAMLMSQALALWQMRRRIALFAALIAVTGSALAFEIHRHRDHIQQLAWDARALLLGEDPAVAALSQPALRCNARTSSDRTLQSVSSSFTPSLAFRNFSHAN